jgi:hypothetical protein
MVAHACHPKYAGNIKNHGPGINGRPYLKNNKAKRTGVMAQVVECLPSKCEALSSNASIYKNTF